MARRGACPTALGPTLALRAAFRPSAAVCRGRATEGRCEARAVRPGVGLSGRPGPGADPLAAPPSQRRRLQGQDHWGPMCRPVPYGPARGLSDRPGPRADPLAAPPSQRRRPQGQDHRGRRAGRCRAGAEWVCPTAWARPRARPGPVQPPFRRSVAVRRTRATEGRREAGSVEPAWSGVCSTALRPGLDPARRAPTAASPSAGPGPLREDAQAGAVRLGAGPVRPPRVRP